MTPIDPTTGYALSDAEATHTIQRCLFATSSSGGGGKVHVYNIPPLSSNKGHDAATWTADDNKRMIFTARLRVLESAITPAPASTPSPTPTSASNIASSNTTSSTPSPTKPILRIDILLEDPSTRALFASCPYTSTASVMQALGSSRFFALRVVGEGGMKATLGIGFEERSDAFDFNTTLQDVRKLLGGFDANASASASSEDRSKNRNSRQASKGIENEALGDTFARLDVNDRNYNTGDVRIKVDLSAGKRMRAQNVSKSSTDEYRQINKSKNEYETYEEPSAAAEAALFSIQAPPSGGIPILPPPPPASSTSSSDRSNRRRIRSQNDGSPTENKLAHEVAPSNPFGDIDENNGDNASSALHNAGNDDDEFGDFC